MRVRFMIGIWLLCVLTLVPTFAQSDEIVISLAVQDYELDDYRKTIIPQFEAENPGIRVHLDTTGGYNDLYWNEDTEYYLDAVYDLAHRTDVFGVNQYLQRDATRTGYILDLAPLARSDMSLNQADYYPNLWESFTWDGGIWAIPSSFDPYVVLYDTEAFNQAGLPYPDASWDIYDYSNAIRSLSNINPDGTVEKLAVDFYYNNSQEYFLLALLNNGIYNDNGLQLNAGQVQPLLDEWQALADEGYFNSKREESGSSGVVIISATGQQDIAPMVIAPVTMAGFLGTDNTNIGVSLLPNAYSAIDTIGYAVSAGTQYPEASYNLAKFIANHPIVIRNEFLGRSANRNVDTTNIDDEIQFNILDMLDPVIMAQAEEAFNNTRPATEAHFFSYVSQLFLQMMYGADGVDPDRETYTLEDIGTKIDERLQQAGERANTPIAVNPPPAKVELAPGQVALNFFTSTNMSPFPYQEQWDRFISDFVASDPTVGHVNLDTSYIQNLESAVERYDCFYVSDTSLINSSSNLSLLLSLDPFISTDPNNVSQDWVTGALDRTQFNGQTYGFPLTLRPENLIYKPEMFQQANAGDPLVSWTISDFENALWALQSTMENDEEPFQPMLFNTQHLFMLMIAYGGNPFDLSVSPPRFDFTNEATVNATKQVLDLVRNGLMSYTDLAVSGGSMSFSSDDTAPLSISMMGGGSMTMSIMGPSGEIEYIPTYAIPYPSGSLYTPVSYFVGAAYISSSTPYAEECYRFISAISQQEDLFIGEMPALKSLIASPELENSHQTAVVDFYRQFAAQLEQPNTFVLPNTEISYYIGGFSELMWVYQVFDDYVKNGDQVDLTTALAEAQVKMDEQYTCVSGLETDIMTIQTQAEYESYLKDYEACIQQIDPNFTMP